MCKLIELQKNMKFTTSANSIAIYATDRRFVSVSSKLQQEQQEITMFTCRKLILTIIISLAKIVFGDILVQPGYEHRYSHNMPYQTVSDYTVPSVAEQHAKQLAVSPLKQYPSGVQIMHPYYLPEVHQDEVRSNSIRYPFRLLQRYPHHYISTKPTGNLHYMKLRSHEYMHPSVFIAHSNPLAAHYRYKRSTDFTNVQSNKPTIATHDVATKSSLIDTKYSTAVDSLPENKSTDTNDKHVKTQSDFAANPFLFGLNPNKMYSKFQTENQDDKQDETQHPVSKRNHATLITSLTPLIVQPFTPESAKATVTEPAQQTSSSQKKDQSQELSRTNQEDLTPDPSSKSSTNSEQSMSPRTIPWIKEDWTTQNKKYNLPLIVMPSYPWIRMPYPWANVVYKEDQSNQTFSKKSANIDAINVGQPRRIEFTHLCGDVPCSSNVKRLPKKLIYTHSDIPTLTPEQSPTYKGKESSLRSEMISAPNLAMPQIFYVIPNDNINYYLDDYQDSMKDYLDLDTDYSDYDDKPTFSDGFTIYLKKNPAYLNDIPSNKIDYYRYGNVLYRNSNPQSNVAPMYVAPTSSQVQLSDYYSKKAGKTYASDSPHFYKHYIYDTKNQMVPNVFYRRMPYSQPVYY